MSAAVHCGRKRSSRFDDYPVSAPKKFRGRSSESPTSFSPPPPAASVLNQLSARFPHLDAQVLKRTLEECGNDFEAAIKRLQEFHLGSLEVNGNSKEEDIAHTEKGAVTTDEDVSTANGIPVDGSEWVELLLKEMSCASSLDDARARATRVLEALEQSICQRARSEAAQSIEKENIMLKQHMEVLVRDNTILKRAVAIQHERQKDYEDRNRELQHMKQLLSHYQEQLKKLELDNYALTLRLKDAQLSHSVPRHFPPDVY